MARHLWTALLTVAVCGLVLVATSFLNPGVAQTPKADPAPAAGASGRYQMLVWGAKENPYLVLVDTQTGRAWYRGQMNTWEDLKTPPSQPSGRTDEKAKP